MKHMYRALMTGLIAMMSIGPLRADNLEKEIDIIGTVYDVNDNSPLAGATVYIEELEKGVVPAKFGGSAMGGAVNIVIKEYPDHYADVSYQRESYNTNRFASDSDNRKLTLLNKLYIEYLLSQRNSVIFNSVLQTADGRPSDDLKILSLWS